METAADTIADPSLLPGNGDVDPKNPFSRQRVTITKAEHIELIPPANYWEAQHAQLKKKCAQLEQENQRKDARIRDLQNRAFGKRCPGVAGVITAPPPPRLIPRSPYGVSLWVDVMLSKFHYSQPTRRYLQDLNDRSLPVSPGPVAGGLQAERVIIVRDRYSAYKKLARLADAILLAFCWAHVRRDFLDAGRSYKVLEPWALDLAGRTGKPESANATIAITCVSSIGTARVRSTSNAKPLIAIIKPCRRPCTRCSKQPLASVRTMRTCWTRRPSRSQATAQGPQEFAPADIWPWLPWTMDPARRAELARPPPTHLSPAVQDRS